MKPNVGIITPNSSVIVKVILFTDKLNSIEDILKHKIKVLATNTELQRYQINEMNWKDPN